MGMGAVPFAFAQDIIPPIIIADNNRVLRRLNFRENKKAIFLIIFIVS